MKKTNSELKIEKQTAAPYLFILVPFILMAVFYLYPIFYMVYLSFFKWNMMKPKKFIGLHNYIQIFHDPDVWQIGRNTCYYMIFTVAFSLILSLLLALYLKENTRTNRFIQSCIFSPYIIPLVSVAFIWTWIMDSDFGLLNYLLSCIGLKPVKWLNDPDMALTSLVIVSVWKNIGYNTIIISSALAGIPKYLYEAAELDEANPVTVFFKITIKMISPTMFFLLLVNIISAFKAFEIVQIMTLGGPQNSTNTIVYAIYQYGFKFYKIGFASALGVILLIVISILTYLYFKLLKSNIHYQ
ncbi:MAG: sugar ABC transporter permease [Spirochaetales bacterium]|nr:sugar ABC transporter permease [Spirochaetales bacterium]